MYSYAVENGIPKYSLSQASDALFDHFMIKRLDGIHRQHPAIFLEPHRKDYYMFVLVDEGSSRHWVDMVPYVLKPNTFYFSVPQQIHVKEQAQPLTGIMLCFTNDFLAIADDQSLLQLPVVKNANNLHELHLDTEDLDFVRDIMNKILAEYGHYAGWQHSMLMAYLKVLLIFLSRIYADQYSDPAVQTDRALLNRFRASIGENYYRIHDVAGYADLLNITPGYLNEIVKQQSGKTAIEHIHERLMLEAKRFLFHSDNSIKEIAFSLGFEDASYFNRFFKRIDGQTPLVYRTLSREMYR